MNDSSHDIWKGETVPSKEIRKVPVELAERSYDVSIGPGLLGEVGSIIARTAGERISKRAVVITDSTVHQLYCSAVQDSLNRADFKADCIDFPAGEEHKNIRTYEVVMNSLLSLEPPIDRRSVIVALGGGVVGDLAGFVAATALRGIDFVNVPTTLLADVDAAIGGKTGIDAPTGKNLIGAFHQPRAVIIDPTVLKTLPAGQMGNGLAECVKHGIIRDTSLLDFIEENAEKIFSFDADILTELIARNVAIKSAVVAADEHEAGQRAHLNFGHTIGHAIEAAGGYGLVSHGQAVSLGMVAACHIASRRGLIGVQDTQRVESVLKKLSLPVRFTDLPPLPEEVYDIGHLQDFIARDKKASLGRPRFILPAGQLGKVDIFDDISEEEIEQAVATLMR